MGQACYYSSPLNRDLVTLLYHTAKSKRILMTRLASRLVREGLARLESKQEPGISIVKEDSPAADPQAA